MVTIHGLPNAIVNPNLNRPKRKKITSHSASLDSPLIIPPPHLLFSGDDDGSTSEQINRLQYDSPTNMNRNALSVYVGIALHEKREAISALFYLDVFV